MKALTKKVLQDITQRKLRTVLTILGITIGIIGLSAISIASSQFKSSFEYSTNVSARPDFTLYTPPTSAGIVEVLKKQPNVKEVQAQGHVTARWSTGANHIPIRVIGVIDFQNLRINKFEVVEGREPGAGEILLESSSRALHDVHIGDKISIEANGTTQEVTISGFARTQGLPSATIDQRAQGYMSAASFNQLFHLQGATDFLFILTNNKQLDETMQQVTQILAERQVHVDAADIEEGQNVTSLADGLFATMNVLSIISIILSVCLLLGTIMALMTEQVRYMGTMKAIGADRGQVMRHYLTLVLIYSLVGTLVGLLLGIAGGYWLSHLLGDLVNMDVTGLTISPLLFLEVLVIGIGVPLLAAAFPIFTATRLTVHQALSGYGIESGAQGTQGWWSAFTRRSFALFPQTMQFGIRSMFRKRTRTILTLVTLSIAGAAFLAVQTTSYSFNTFLDQIFTTYSLNVKVILPTAVPYAKVQETLANVSGIKQMEPLMQSQVKTNWGPALLTGVNQDTTMYQKQIVAGRWFDAADQNVVLISKDAADKSGLKVGDTIAFHDPANKATWKIIGIIKDYNGIGSGNLGALLAPRAQVNAFYRLPADATAMVMIQSVNQDPAQVTDLANRVDKALSSAGWLPNVTTAQQEIQQNHDKYQIIYILLYAVAVIIALVGAISLSNTLAMSVLERRREIGILRSMGATGRKVIQVFWSEAMTLGLISWLVALLLGVPAAYGFVWLQGRLLAPIPFAFNALHLVWMFVFMILVASLASIGPVVGASRVRIAQTLRYE